MTPLEQFGEAEYGNNRQNAEHDDQPHVLIGLHEHDEGQGQEHADDSEEPFEVDAGEIASQGHQQHGVEAGAQTGLLARAPDREINDDGDTDAYPVPDLRHEM